MVDRFAARLAELDATFHRAPDRPTATTMAKTGLTPPRHVREKGLTLFSHAVSIVEAEVGVAATGAVAWAHGPERLRRPALLPDRQVVLLDLADLVETTAEALARFTRRPGGIPANVVFVAGPSRTADIEQRMMLGVHAPRSLDVIVFG